MAQQSSSSIFRKEALERLSSPEDLDRLMQVTTLQSWLAFLGLALILGISILLALYYPIPTQTSQTGVLVLSNPIVYILAPKTGRVSALLADPDQQVLAGQVVAEIEIPGVDGQPQKLDVKATLTGRILEQRLKIGAAVSQDTPIMSEISFDGSIDQRQIITYLDIDQIGPVKVGQSVQISPSTAPAAQYGYIRGTVASVSPFASTQDEMRVATNNPALIDTLIQQNAIYEVRIDIESANGQFVWTISNPNPLNIPIETTCTVTITTKEEHPIDRLFPRSN
jgi:multidrug resistance efflux pump